MVIVTEMLPGLSLRKYLTTIRPKQLDPYVAIKFSLDVARAMDWLHANGIIHRDLKPGRYLLCVCSALVIFSISLMFVVYNSLSVMAKFYFYVCCFIMDSMDLGSFNYNALLYVGLSIQYWRAS